MCGAFAQVTALGLPPGPAYRKLKEGQTVTLASGTVIRPEDVVGPPCVGRKVACS
jgi:ribonuclease Z